MTVKESLSPRDLASALGVSESSVRRWVDRGDIRVQKTQGGHRRIPLGEAVAFVRSSGLPTVRPEALGLDAVLSAGPAAAEAFEDALHAGSEQEAASIALGEFLGGREIAEIGDLMIQPALRKIGELWRRGDDGILVEHRATAICAAILHRLRSLLPSPTSLRAVGGAFPGDPYTVPSLLASVVLQSEGFETVDLGANTPLAVIRQAVREHDPRLVWIAANYIDEPGAAAAELELVLDDLEGKGRVVVVGGRHAHDLELAPRSYLRRAANMRELGALAQGLRLASGG